MERVGIKVDTIALFSELKNFFNEQVEKGIFTDVPVTVPYYIGIGEKQKIKWYADNWYRCNVCGCLWEFKYPDFPANGFVRKFEDGNYMSR